MADNTNVRFLFPQQQRFGGIGLLPTYPAGVDEEGQPSVLWGQGTPDGDRAPFTLVNKGSLYLAVDQTDDTTAVWQKVDEGDANSDWVRVFIENQALIDTNDLAAAAGITPAQLATDQDHIWMCDIAIDISATSAEHVVFHAVTALTITEIGVVYTEATDADPGAGTVAVGVTTGGVEVVAAVQHDANQSVGDYQALTVADGAMAAGESLFLNHVQAASEAGIYRLMFKYDLD